MITGFECQVQQFPGHHHFTVADEIEDRFNFVGKGGYIVESEHRAGTLDGVHGPKNAVDKVLVGGRFFKIEQGCFQFGKQFAGFFPICGDMLFNHDGNPLSNIGA